MGLSLLLLLAALNVAVFCFMLLQARRAAARAVALAAQLAAHAQALQAVLIALDAAEHRVRTAPHIVHHPRIKSSSGVSP